VEKDWRLEQLETQPHLRGVRFVRKPYREYRPGWDHDRCVFCGATLAEPTITGENFIHEGYATAEDFVRGADYDWVCVPCFGLFREDMG
jgi:hypothetical protein